MLAAESKHLHSLRAVSDCTYVIHVASPFPDSQPGEPSSVVIPAVEGTKRVLDACKRAGTVKRVVLTSSIAAISGQLRS